MASGTSSFQKRNSLHRLSHILQLAPSFPRPSFDSQRRSSRKSPSTKADGARSTSASSATYVSSHGRASFNATASVVSATNSCLSSPQCPLLPPSSSFETELPVPPTTNELATDEKMKLIRKARKLSRVLGEVPVAQATHDAYSLPDSPLRLSDVAESPFLPSRTPSLVSSSNKIQTVSASAKKAFRRSLTFVHSGSSSALQVHDVQRSKSFSTLRPSLQIPSTSSLCSESAPYSPILFATPLLPTSSDMSHSGSRSPFDSEDMIEEVPSDTLSRHLQSSSITSLDSVEPPVLSLEQLQRQRMAKLTRHLGDSIPPEVLLRAASPPTPQINLPKIYSVRDPDTVLSADNLHRIVKPLRDNLALRRRPISMEFSGHRKSGVVSAPVTPIASPDPGTENFAPVRLRKLSRVQAGDDADAANGSGVCDDDAVEIFDPSEPLTEQQRIRNVKRARKMTQLFGDNPPTALFQITNFGPSSQYERDSIATFISITASSMSSLTGNAGPKLTDSFISVVTASSDVSPLVCQEDSDDLDADLDTDDESEEHEHEFVPEKQEASLLSGMVEVPLLRPVPLPHRKRSNRPSTSPGPSRPTSSRAQEARKLSVPAMNLPPRTPPTPPPFSNFIDTTPAPKSATITADATSHDFHARRRRAAKLSQFFGVEVNTLVEAFPNDAPASMPTHQDPCACDAPLYQFAARDGVMRAPSVTVAEAKNRRRFLGVAEDKDLKELDMSEVIEQLRRMKSH